MADSYRRVLRIGESMRCQQVLKGAIHHYEATVSVWWSTIPTHELSHGSVHALTLLDPPLWLVTVPMSIYSTGPDSRWAPFPLVSFIKGKWRLLCWVHQRNMGGISGSVQLDQRGNSPGKRVHGERERGQARRFSLFDMMVAIERGREEGFIQSLLGRAAGSQDVWPHWSWGLSRAGGPLPGHHTQPCRVNPLRSIGWAGKEEPRDHPVTIFNIAVIDLPLSPSLLCPSCHKL